MAKVTQYVKIKDLEIPIEIKSYKNSKSLKIYFKGNSLNITKPKRLPMSVLIRILKENEDNLYNKYKQILESGISTIKQWKTGEKIYYICHLKYKYHDKQFYDLVATYIPNYKEIDKWLKQYGKIIMF